MRQKLKDAVLRGLSAAVFSAAVMYLGLRAWIVTTVSIGPVDTLYSMVDTATVLAALSAFLTTATASYTSGE